MRRRSDVCQVLLKIRTLRATAMEQYCLANQIWLKDVAAHVVDKNQVVRQVARERKIEEGLVCAISAGRASGPAIPDFANR